MYVFEIRKCIYFDDIRSKRDVVHFRTIFFIFIFIIIGVNICRRFCPVIIVPIGYCRSLYFWGNLIYNTVNIFEKPNYNLILHFTLPTQKRSRQLHWWIQWWFFVSLLFFLHVLFRLGLSSIHCILCQIEKLVCYVPMNRNNSIVVHVCRSWIKYIENIDGFGYC